MPSPVEEPPRVPSRGVQRGRVRDLHRLWPHAADGDDFRRHWPVFSPQGLGAEQQHDSWNHTGGNWKVHRAGELATVQKQPGRENPNHPVQDPSDQHRPLRKPADRWDPVVDWVPL